MENDDPVLPPEIITGLQEMLRSGVRPEVIADSLGSVIDTLHGLQVPRTLALGLVKLLCRGMEPADVAERLGPLLSILALKQAKDCMLTPEIFGFPG